MGHLTFQSRPDSRRPDRYENKVIANSGVSKRRVAKGESKTLLGSGVGRNQRHHRVRAMCSWDRFCTFAREPEQRKVGLDGVQAASVQNSDNGIWHEIPSFRKFRLSGIMACKPHKTAPSGCGALGIFQKPSNRRIADGERE